MRYSVLAILFALPLVAQEMPAGLSIELNALDQVDGACRLVFVARNATDADIDALVLETVAFDAEGGVTGISLFDFATLPADLPRVRQFDLPGTACDEIGSLLVNGVQACEGGACDAPLSVGSRTGVEFLG